jgi:integrase
LFRARVLVPAGEAAGLAGIHPHDLRHTAASLWAKAGFSLYEVSRSLGHANISITADLYTHLFPAERSEKHDRLDAMYEAGVGSASEAEVIHLGGR